MKKAEYGCYRNPEQTKLNTAVITLLDKTNKAEYSCYHALVLRKLNIVLSTSVSGKLRTEFLFLLFQIYLLSTQVQFHLYGTVTVHEDLPCTYFHVYSVLLQYLILYTHILPFQRCLTHASQRHQRK